jgi:hypothetical protein
MQRDALARFDAINAALDGGVGGAGGLSAGDLAAHGLEGLDAEQLLEEQAAVTEAIEKLDCWNLHAQVGWGEGIQLWWSCLGYSGAV